MRMTKPSPWTSIRWDKFPSVLHCFIHQVFKINLLRLNSWISSQLINRRNRISGYKRRSQENVEYNVLSIFHNVYLWSFSCSHLFHHVWSYSFPRKFLVVNHITRNLSLIQLVAVWVPIVDEMTFTWTEYDRFSVIWTTLKELIQIIVLCQRHRI